MYTVDQGCQTHFAPGPHSVFNEVQKAALTIGYISKERYICKELSSIHCYWNVTFPDIPPVVPDCPPPLDLNLPPVTTVLQQPLPLSVIPL